MTRFLRVAALQLRAHDRANFAAEFPGIGERVERAARAADLVVLPEGTLPGYVLGEDAHDDAAVARALDDLRSIAARCESVIVVGTVVRDADVLYNAGIVIDRDGAIAGRADKIFLWHFDNRWFAPGKAIAPIETSIGTLGVLVCADGRIPEIARALVDRGAELLVMPTAWVSSGRDPQALENPIADLLGRVRAYENGVPFIAADKCGVEREMVLYCGKSQIVDASGGVVAIASERDETTVAAEIEIAPARPARSVLGDVATRESPTTGIVRIAVTAEALPADAVERLAILACDFAIAPGSGERLAALDSRVPTVVVDDLTVRDPAGLAFYRRAGYRVAVWFTRGDSWTESLARARAGENRMYVVAVDASMRRAFVADPEYAVVCGTFGEYRIASCALDLAKTAHTLVAPGTDVAEGLTRVRTITA